MLGPPDLLTKMHALKTHDQTSSPLLRNKLAVGGIIELIIMFVLILRAIWPGR